MDMGKKIIMRALLIIFLIIVIFYTVETTKGSGQLLCDAGFENSIANGTFPSSGCWHPSSAGGGAYAVVTTTAAHSGNNGLWIYSGNETWAYWSRPYQEFNASAGQVYSGSAWIRTPSGQGWVTGSLANVRIDFLNSSNILLTSINSNNVSAANSDWAHFAISSNPAPTGTSYVRFICNIEKPNGSSGQSVANFDDTYFELINNPPNIPSSPSPGNGASNVSTTATLSWRGGDPDSGDIVTYDVYFGTTSNPGKVTSNQSSTSYAPGTLTYSTTYCWKIVARDNNGAETVGPVWSFTTGSAPCATPGTPSSPSPSNRARRVSTSPILSWSSCANTDSYDVYFGTSSNPPYVGNTTSTNYSRSGLSYSTLYYWKIVAKNNCGNSTSGPVWRFTTANTTGSPVGKAYEHLYEVMDKYHKTFDVYTDLSAAGNHCVTLGRVSSPGDEDKVSINPGYTVGCYSGCTCIENRFYSNGENWGGWYFMNGFLEGEETKPKLNWGDYPCAGFDLTGAKKLNFWARGEKGGENVEFFAFGVGRDAETGNPIMPYPDSSKRVTLGNKRLSNKWKKYTINLTNQDLSYVLGCFGWVADASNNQNKDITFYLDEIRYDKSLLNGPRFLVSYETICSDLDFDMIMKNVAFTYDNALVLIAFLSRGENDDLRRANLLADAFVYAIDNDRIFEDGRLRNAYQGGDLILFPGWNPNGKADTVRMPGWWDSAANTWYEDKFQVGTQTGNLAWAMIALLTYFEKMGGNIYLEATKTLGEWIEGKTRDSRGAGGFTGGYDGWERTGNNPQGQAKILWKSTEHNIDVYVAFMRLYEATQDQKWKNRSLHAKSFVEAMWDEAGGHFWTGTLEDGITINTSTIPADVNTWGPMALGNINKYGAGISWVESNCYVEADGFKGFDFNNDRDHVWFEGTAHVVLAYQMIGDTTKADTYLSELRRARTEAPNNNGKGIVAASYDGLTTGFDWLYYNRLHIGATAWYIFGESEYNPYWGIKITDPIPQP